VFSSLLLPDVALKYNVTSHLKALLLFKKIGCLGRESWVENPIQGIPSQQYDPINRPEIEERARLKKMVEELRHDVHHYRKKDTIPVLETTTSVLKL
jgi:hypothetical protein